MSEVKEGEEVGSLADHHPIKKMVVASTEVSIVETGEKWTDTVSIFRRL